MTTKQISIGNSKGIRIPKLMIEQYHLGEGDILLEAEDNGILIKPVKKSRVGWAEQFSKAVKQTKKTKQQDDTYIQNNFDETEWIW